MIFSPVDPAKTFAPVSTLIPGTAPVVDINSGIVFFELEIWLIVSSYKITPPMKSLIPLAENKVSLNNNLFSGFERTLIESSLLVIVPLLSSAASIPLPLDIIFNAILFSSDILI